MGKCFPVWVLPMGFFFYIFSILFNRKGQKIGGINGIPPKKTSRILNTNKPPLNFFRPNGLTWDLSKKLFHLCIHKKPSARLISMKESFALICKRGISSPKEIFNHHPCEAWKMQMALGFSSLVGYLPSSRRPLMLIRCYHSFGLP